MKPIRLNGPTLDAGDVDGRVLTHDLAANLRKGTVLSAADVERLRPFDEIHVVELEPGDVHEDEAGRKLAEAIASLGSLRVEGPVPSQYRLRADPRAPLRAHTRLRG